MLERRSENEREGPERWKQLVRTLVDNRKFVRSQQNLKKKRIRSPSEGKYKKVNMGK